MITELSNWGFMGLGICGGFILGLYYYDVLIVKMQKAKIKAAIAGFNDALVSLGISKDKDGKWQMKPEDRDEVWIKKE
jgi:hypothetical protein